MQKLKYILLCSLILISIATAQNKSSVYEFPIKGGSPEWKKLKTHDEMLKVCQIPAGTLNNMNTKDLLQTCMNYPLFPDMWAFNSLQNGFEHVKKSFNGINELYIREDKVKELVLKYKDMEPGLYDNEGTILDKGKYSMEFAKIEILLCQPEILKEMTKQEKTNLLFISFDKYEKMLKHPHIYSINSLEPLSYLMIKILQLENLQDFEDIGKANKNFLMFSKTASMASKKTINDIVELTKKYLQK